MYLIAREFGRQAFGENPANYHNSRAGYPDWLYATLVSTVGLRRNAAFFEIGAGTGTATLTLLDLGANPLTAVEPDQCLATFLRTHNREIANLLRPGGRWAAFLKVPGDDSQPDPFHEATKDLLGPPANPLTGE